MRLRSRRGRGWSARCSSACRSRRPWPPASRKPVVAVHHLAGHIESIFLEHGDIPLPAACSWSRAATRACISCPSRACTVSSAARATTRRARRTTRWRSCSVWAIRAGRRSIKLAREGDDQAIDLPRTRLTHADRNPPPPDLASPFPPGLKHVAEFSFSGLKTAVVRYLRERGVAVATGLAVPSDAGPLSPKEVADVCASFQRVVVDALVDRTFAAARVARGAQHRHRRRRLGQQPPAARRGRAWRA